MVWPKGKKRPESGKGRGAAYLRDRVNHEGPDCLIWPFARTFEGYGHLQYKGRGYSAHRLMCMFAHGDPPTPEHEAAHSCGRGHEGCINPSHLSWLTRAENQQERYLHRRKPTARRKLSNEQVSQIRTIGNTKGRAEVAQMFGISRGTVRKIMLGETWRDVE